MNTFYNYLIPEERQGWRSAYEIEIAARKHEEHRLRWERENTEPIAPVDGVEKRGLISTIKLSLQLLSGMFG